MALAQEEISQDQRQAERTLLLSQMRSSLDQEMIAIVQVSWEDITPDSRLAASMLAMNLCAEDRNIASLFEEERIKLSREVMRTISFRFCRSKHKRQSRPCLIFAKV